MTVARGFFDGKSVYTNIVKRQMDVNLNFIVDSTNGNGLGIRSLKSNGFVEAVFMNTSATPGKSPGGLLNPNPAAGFAEVIFKNNFNYYLGGYSGFVSPVASSSNTVVANDVYVITSLGTTTLAQWVAAGFPSGFVPAVGSVFCAASSGAVGGTGTAALSTASSILTSTVVGDPNQEIANTNIAKNAGARVWIQFNAATNSSTTTPIAAAPSNNSVIGMMFRFDGSSVTVDGL